MEAILFTYVVPGAASWLVQSLLGGIYDWL